MTDNPPATTGGIHPLKRAAARRGVHCNIHVSDGRVTLVFRRRRDATRFRAATYNLDDLVGVRWAVDPWPGSWAKWSRRVSVPASEVAHLLDTLTGGDRS